MCPLLLKYPTLRRFLPWLAMWEGCEIVAENHDKVETHHMECEKACMDFGDYMEKWTLSLWTRSWNLHHLSLLDRPLSLTIDLWGIWNPSAQTMQKSWMNLTTSPQKNRSVERGWKEPKANHTIKETENLREQLWNYEDNQSFSTLVAKCWVPKLRLWNSMFIQK